MKDLYNKVKREMINKSENESNDLFLIEVKEDKNLNNLLNQIKILRILAKVETGSYMVKICKN